MTMKIERPDYITLIRDRNGYRVAQMRFYGTFYNIMHTGDIQHPTKEQAIAEGKNWADTKQIRFVENV